MRKRVGERLPFCMENSEVNPQRVLLVDRDAFELATLSAALRLHGVNIVGEAFTISLAEKLFHSLRPEIVLKQLRSPAEEGLSFLNRVRKVNPNLGIVIMTEFPDFRLIGSQEKNIPRGSKVILKRSLSDLSILTENISASLNPAKDESRVNWISNHESSRENSPVNKIKGLTDVQVETFRLVAQGLSNSEIARVRFVSEKSVEQIIARLAKELGISADPTRNLRVRLAAEYFTWVHIRTP